MKALDLYCGAGGATRGLQQASFHVVGIDLYPQPNYIGDHSFRLTFCRCRRTSCDLRLHLVEPTVPGPLDDAPRAQRQAPPQPDPGHKGPTKGRGKPFVIENVEGARAHLHSPTRLCGSMFGLRAPSGELRRHRLFEASFLLTAPSKCRHGKPTIGVYGAHNRDRRRPSGTNHKSGSNWPWEHGFIAMGVPIGSMTLAELSESIPPAYSRFVAEASLAWA